MRDAVVRPLVLLDVDGVLNALGPADDSWPLWRRGTADALGRGWPVRFSPGVVAAVTAWCDRADVRWLTTWGPAANGGLRELLGLPELPVAGAPGIPAALPVAAHSAVPPPGAGQAGAPGTDAGRRGPGGAALAAVTPAAPDPLTGTWWKFDVVRALLHDQPERRVAWLDDDLAQAPDVRAWMRSHADCLLVAPDRTTGLLPRHVHAVERFLSGG